MLLFDRRYLILTIILFITEVVIALYLHDAVIRPYVGDFLVVILLYCFVKTFLHAPPLPIAIGVLLFSFIIEGLQYIHFIALIGWQNNQLARIVFGTSFSPVDLVAYVLGIVTVIIIENRISKKKDRIRSSGTVN